MIGARFGFHKLLNAILCLTTLIDLSAKQLDFLNCCRVEDAHESEARGFLWHRVQLADKEETGARHPPAVPCHADLPG